ncbi:MAG TPA: hypothetical protein VE974_10300 [Thermoanaerobaculia bacterium]|nr:hypothetical protein [Thermoanaerobaculia bacterium]
MKSSWRHHHGTPYFHADYSGFGRNIDALRIEVDGADSQIEQSAADSALVLVDIRNTVTSIDVVSLFKESTARTKGHVKKTAIVGVRGVQRILATAVARFSGEDLHLFDTVEAARDWLAGEGAGGQTIPAE